MADFYIRSATALDRVLRDECSVKAAASVHADSGRVLALLINALAYRSALLAALDAARVLKLEAKVFTILAPPPKSKNDKPKQKQKADKKELKEVASAEAMCLVLCHDLLFQSRGIQASKTWPPKVALEKYRSSLHSALVKMQIRQGKARIQDLRSGALYHEMTARMPRWIRINSLRATRDEVLAWLAEHSYTQVETDEIGGVKEFAVSRHVQGLLAFHPKATSALLQTEMYRDNWIVMQDLASCFPAYILDPPADAQVVDATSAPGNKTSHLSAIMFAKSSRRIGQSEGKVVAFERDAVRYKTLVKRLAAVGALAKDGTTGNVVPERRDFLTTNPTDFGEVTHMLLDPSCSGSGIVNRLDFLKEDDDVDELEDTVAAETGETKLQRRLRQLGEFQLLMIRHAFKFPALRKVVYSTCSVHAQENESVVIRALHSEEADKFGWRLAPRSEVIPTWPVRGDPDACGEEKDVAENVIRCIPGGKGEGDKPHVEACNGFFVACFVKHAPTKRPLEEEQDAAPTGNSANRKKKLQKRRQKQRLAQQA